MAPVVASNGNTVQMAGLEDSQVNAIMVQTRAQAGRLTNVLLQEIKFCYKKIAVFRTFLSSIQQGSFLLTEQAQGILKCHARCKTRLVEAYTKFADLKALKIETWDKKDDEGLEKVLTLLNSESDVYQQKLEEVQLSNMEIFEKCLTLTALTTPHTMKETQATTPNITDQKLLFLDVHNVLWQSN